jgi:kynurenine formamidase
MKGTATMTTEPESLRSIGERLSNAGRWGADDERGTLNHLGPEGVVAAARLVRSGRVVAAGHTFTMQATERKPRAGYHRMLYRENRMSAVDAVMIEPHGYEITHVDALGHVGMDGVGYNDRPFEDIVTRDGLTFGSVLPLSDGIVTRGVLLDLPRSQERPWLERDETVRVADLERAEQWAGLTVGRGDALVVRVGLDAREAATGPQSFEERTGLGTDCIPWLANREVAIFGGDCFERLPSGDSTYSHPLHSVGLARIGLVLVDHIAVEGLGEACVDEGRWEFLFAAAPLRIPRATGSPVNPLCIF